MTLHKSKPNYNSNPNPKRNIQTNQTLTLILTLNRALSVYPIKTTLSSQEIFRITTDNFSRRPNKEEQLQKLIHIVVVKSLPVFKLWALFS